VSKPLARAGQLRPRRLNKRLREQGSSARTLELEEEVAELRSTTGAMVALNKQQKGEITRMYKEHIDAMQLRQELEGRAQELRGKLVTRESQMAQVRPRLGSVHLG
jgi:seryl-tRNA synthetase